MHTKDFSVEDSEESADIADVVAALRLRFSRSCSTIETSAVLKTLAPENVVCFVNLATIRESDDVLDLFGGSEMITCAVSYLYKPKTLISADIRYSPREGTWSYNVSQNWREFEELLLGYSHTTPRFVAQDAIHSSFADNSFDVILGDLPGPSIKDTHRGDLPYGIGMYQAYEIYDKVLRDSVNLLRGYGTLVLMVRPDWIMRSWKKLNDLGLLLEYPEYALTFSNELGPLSFIGLRFSKQPSGLFDISRQKRAVLGLMEAAEITGLYAHDQGVTFPFREAEPPEEATFTIAQDVKSEQYFFTQGTSRELAKLSSGNTAYLAVPSVAVEAAGKGYRGVLFEADGRVLRDEIFKGPKTAVRSVKYDFSRGLTRQTGKFSHTFETVICDPPFTQVKPRELANDIYELLHVSNSDPTVYVVYPEGKRGQLKSAMAQVGLRLDEDFMGPSVRYANPPNMVYEHGPDVIKVYKFTLSR